MAAKLSEVSAADDEADASLEAENTSGSNDADTENDKPEKNMEETGFGPASVIGCGIFILLIAGITFAAYRKKKGQG